MTIEQRAPVNPLTDAQLRAAPVEITGTVTTSGGPGGGLTDAELRAAPVEVDITNASVPVSAASLPLPSGASTAANQTTANASLASIDGKMNAKGQATMANSMPVVIASNQTAVPVSFSAAAATRYFYNIPSQVHVAAANTVHWDFFNADAALIVRVLGIWHIPDMVTAVATGVAFSWKLARTTTVGTGGSALTAWLPDTTQTALDADITARSKPTGGAAESTILRNYGLHGEETNTGTIVAASLGGLNLVPSTLRSTGVGIVLRQNQGLRCVQITNSALGNSGWLIEFTVE